MEQHQCKVRAIAARVSYFHIQKIPFRVYHGSTNSTRHAEHDPSKVVDTTPLTKILTIDHDRHVAIVEPNVSMSALVKATVAAGYIPQVVPEFPAITVGGAFSGTAAESSSFKFGYFDQSINWIEIVLADGRVVTASPEENADLFYSTIGACGTLGVATLFEIKLLPTSTFVELTYLPVHSFSAATTLLDDCINDATIDYVDGIMFSASLGVIITGRLTSDHNADMPIARFSRWKDPWFYHHAHSQVAHLRHEHCDTCPVSSPRDPRLPEKPRELVPVEDYFFRYDRGCFWMGSYGW